MYDSIIKTGVVMDFKDWVYKKRDDKKWSLQKAAKEAGISKGYWWEVESGQCNPSIEKAGAITKALGYKLSTALRQCGK